MRFRSITAVALSALTLVTAAACGSDDEAPSRSPAESPATTAPSDEAGLTLEDAGAEPRQPLRLHVSPGTTTRTALLSRITLKLTAGGEELPVGVVPGTRLVMEQHVDRVDPDGAAHYTARFTDVTAVSTPGASASVLRETQAALDDMKGLTITGSIDVRGGAQRVEVDTATITDQTLKSMLEAMTSQIGNLAAPFPRSAVGPGARWTAKSSAKIAGITMNTTTHYTLRSRDGDRYELDVAQEADAPPGPVELPNAPSSGRTSIERFHLTSRGAIAGDLTHPLPQRSAMSGGGNGEFAVTAGDESGRFVQEMTIETTLEPA
jgi:hypothetical protein